MKRFKNIILLMSMCFALSACNKETVIEDVKEIVETQEKNEEECSDFSQESEVKQNSESDIPEFSNEPWVEINNNIPYFTDDEITTESFEYYSDLDELGRCGVVYASIGQDLMPTEERGQIGSVKPSGWQSVKYDIVDGKYLYNRCHLIGFQLAGENANEKNLITGTRYMNVDGMLPFENMVADYVKETNNHVMYRVTPIYDGDNLVANGVTIEALSVEDSGEGICFNVYVYNNQPGIEIDYATGNSWLIGENENDTGNKEEKEYVLNTKSKKIHLPSCSSATEMSEKNKEVVTSTLDELLKQGYETCGICKP